MQAFPKICSAPKSFSNTRLEAGLYNKVFTNINYLHCDICNINLSDRSDIIYHLNNITNTVKQKTISYRSTTQQGLFNRHSKISEVDWNFIKTTTAK